MRITDILAESAYGDVLYHGTSLVQFDRMRRNGFIADEIYVGESRTNITDHYSEEKAEEDDSYPVTIFLDAKRLQHLQDDVHHYGDGDELQLGQFIYSGPLEGAIIRATVYDFVDTGDEIELPLDASTPLPLPLHPPPE